jgi:HTH-type transcriptional regulator, sugar sensing transcriptional regulator
MTVVELLQQIGLNKYEAEAYYTLLTQEPLTGYELGKRSQVPLSRSYEILERLSQKGLALVQTGDPPRYTAEKPGQFLGQVRATMLATLDALDSSLAALQRSDTSSEFWILRGRQNILARVQALIAEAQRTIYLSLTTNYEAEVVDLLAFARARGCSVFRSTTASAGNAGAERILLLVDDREALAGLLAPTESCQAVVSTNEGLVATLKGYFANQIPARMPIPSTSTENTQQSDRLDWLAWEERKQRRLWRLKTADRSA